MNSIDCDKLKILEEEFNSVVLPKDEDYDTHLIELGYMSVADGKWSEGYTEVDSHDDIDDNQRPNPDKIVISDSEITVAFTYPLKRQFDFQFKSKSSNGFSRREISELIMKKYHEIYDEETKTTNLPVQNIPGMFNRAKTDGKYGIWGHGIGDLILYSMWSNADGSWSLGIDS